jgi:hypothetical protein
MQASKQARHRSLSLRQGCVHREAAIIAVFSKLTNGDKVREGQEEEEDEQQYCSLEARSRMNAGLAMYMYIPVFSVADQPASLQCSSSAAV